MTWKSFSQMKSNLIGVFKMNEIDLNQLKFGAFCHCGRQIPRQCCNIQQETANYVTFFFFLKINVRAAFFSHFCFFDPGRWKRNCFDLQRGICEKMGNVSPPKRRQKFQVKKIQRGRQWRRDLCQYCDRLEQSWIFQLLKPKITFLLAINRANVQRARPRGKLTMN